MREGMRRNMPPRAAQHTLTGLCRRCRCRRRRGRRRRRSRRRRRRRRRRGGRRPEAGRVRERDPDGHEAELRQPDAAAPLRLTRGASARSARLVSGVLFSSPRQLPRFGLLLAP
jgi:hypothetical protein